MVEIVTNDTSDFEYAVLNATYLASDEVVMSFQNGGM